MSHERAHSLERAQNGELEVVPENQTELQRLFAELRAELRAEIRQHTQTILEAVEGGDSGNGNHHGVRSGSGNGNGKRPSVAPSSTASDAASVTSLPCPETGDLRRSETRVQKSEYVKNVYNEERRLACSTKAIEKTRSNRQFTMTGSARLGITHTAKWEWQRSSGAWQPYPAWACQHIEAAFFDGRSMCHVRSGNDETTPMEIYFADMMQLDPVSGNIRKVQRNGSRSVPFRLNAWVCTHRYVSAMTRDVLTGEPMFESFIEYKERVMQRVWSLRLASHLVDDETLAADAFAHRFDEEDIAGISKHRAVRHTGLHFCMGHITKTSAFVAVSALVTLLQVAWVVDGLHRPEQEGVLLYERSSVDIAVEHFFCIFFLIELTMRYIAMPRSLDVLRDGWFCFDAVCVCLSTLEVLVMAPLDHFGLIASQSTNDQVFRVFRLGRIFRFFRVIRRFHHLQIVIKGALVGMQAAAYVWLLLAVLTFTFGLIILSYIQDEGLKRQYFSSLGSSMQTLFIEGMLLDNIGQLWHAIVDARELLVLVVFCIFQFLALFSLFNMLIGLFCNAATQVAQVESSERDLEYLQQHLLKILQCYLGETRSTVTKMEFMHIMKNMEVNATLRHYGTDVAALMSISETLFPKETSQISLRKFFHVIMRLRSGSPACAAHIVSLAALIEQRFSAIDKWAAEGGRLSLYGTTPTCL